MDAVSRWSVVVDRVEVSSTYYTGEAWDAFGGAPDPFVQVRVGSETAMPRRTAAGGDVFAVSFDGSPLLTDQRADALQTYLRFDVFDEDTAAHDFVGACYYAPGVAPLPAAAFAGILQVVDCPRDATSMNSGFTVEWHLEPF